MAGTKRSTARLVSVETRLAPPVLTALKRVAAQNERSVAAELRVAVQRHIEEAA